MKSDSPCLAFIRIIVVLFPLISLAGMDVTAQRYQAVTYTEADGLANSMVFNVVQDSSGILWIGRRLGISSYDGTGFSNYNISDGLRSASYSFLTIDEKEKLWAIPESGSLFFSRLDGKRWQCVSTALPVADDFTATFTSLDVFYEKGALVLLAGTQDKGFILFKDNHWMHYTTADGIPGGAVNSARGFEGNIYIASDKGLAILHNGILKPVDDSVSSLLGGNILALERRGTLLWILGDGWLGYLLKGKFTLVTNNFLLPLNGMGHHCFLHAGRNGKVFFGNSFKVFAFDVALNSLEKLDRTSGLISEGGTSALVDREMNTWITGYRGITKIPSERFASFSEDDGLFSNEVASAMEVSPGKYIFGHDGAVTFYDGKTMTRLVLNPVRGEANYETRVIDIQKGTNGDIWLAVSSLGVARIDKNRHVTWFHEKQGLEGVAYTIAINPAGEVYAGTTLGLFVYNLGRFNHLDIGTQNNHAFRKIVACADGSLYMATIISGLLLKQGNSVSTFTATENPLANNVFAFFQDSKKRQWVGTAAGLYEIAGRELKRVSRDGLMISRPVYRILEDHTGNIWVGTDNGVYRWDGTTLSHFTVNDGLSGQDINRSAGFADSKNHIWFGTNNGLTVFRPELDYTPGQVPPPKVSLQTVIVGKDSADPFTNMEVRYDRNDFSFHVRVISLINERQVYVKYYLAGCDSGWSHEILYTGSPFIYNNLSSGSYRFYIKARNSTGTWSDQYISATFTIKAPFWLRWWFLASALLIFAAMIYITARFILTNRYKNQLKEQVALQTEELRKSEIKLMEINAAKDSFFSIIAHDLRNPFNAILGFLDLLTDGESDFSKADQNMMLLQLKTASVRTIDLLDNLLTWARSQRGSLPFEPEIFPLRDVIADNCGLFDAAAHSKDISLVMECRDNYRVFADRNMISTVIRNLVSNAIKFTFAGGTIIVGLEQKDPDTVLVYVKDNGMGICPSMMDNLFKIENRNILKGTANETGTGLGLILCKEFVVKNGGTIRVNSTAGAGSTFTFTLPSASSAM